MKRSIAETSAKTDWLGFAGKVNAVTGADHADSMTIGLIAYAFHRDRALRNEFCEALREED